MTKTLYTLIAIIVAFIAGLIVYDVFFVEEEPADIACPAEATSRYTEDELHAAFTMTQGMSRDEANPMWHDTQLEQALTDPVFVAELEAHFCRMRDMVGGR
ncbi:hypothetical protein [Actinomarinicola tropica]|uniref:Uncharacterized protein n=1 Tax=Actinomarinicola tropica TaxID=2789776 RepID=A0A5Q2RQT9_9ACTN|nr:hypothetical protein [Actinomarinicola tropica]QGG96260.1 hypothetical protein GH723_14765 [Actinomarinicola tropica]